MRATAACPTMGLGSDTDDVAYQIVELLGMNQPDAAAAMLGAYYGEERDAIANRAVQMGASSATINELMKKLDSSNEVITVYGTAPKTRIDWAAKAPWIVAAAAVVGVAYYYGAPRKKKARRRR